MSVCSGSNDPMRPSSRFLIEASCIISELLHSRWVARNPSLIYVSRAALARDVIARMTSVFASA